MPGLSILALRGLSRRLLPEARLEQVIRANRRRSGVFLFHIDAAAAGIHGDIRDRIFPQISQRSDAAAGVVDRGKLVTFLECSNADQGCVGIHVETKQIGALLERNLADRPAPQISLIGIPP